MIRAAFFTCVGVVFFAVWLVFRPSYQESASRSDWNLVLGFSAAILALAFALPLFAQLVGGRLAFWVALVPAAGAALARLSNILEDGLQMGWAFFGFIVSAAIIDLGLLALTVVTTLVGRGRRRLLALVPAATMAGITLYVIAGGVLLLATWLGAAAVAVALRTRTVALAAPTTL